MEEGYATITPCVRDCLLGVACLYFPAVLGKRLAHACLTYVIRPQRESGTFMNRIHATYAKDFAYAIRSISQRQQKSYCDLRVMIVGEDIYFVISINHCEGVNLLKLSYDLNTLFDG